MPMTRKQLDDALAGGCTEPGCGCDAGVLYLHPACCRAPVEVSYRRGSGVLRIGCSACHKVVGMIAVAEEITHATTDHDAPGGGEENG